jgi:Protein of unknown function (DUF3152)
VRKILAVLSLLLMVPVTAGPAVAVSDHHGVARTTGRYFVVPGSANSPGLGRVVLYTVEVEGGLPVPPAQFAAEVHRILNSPLGWGQGGRTMRFVRVQDGPVDVRVSLSSPALTDRECAPLQTEGQVSCFNHGRAVINAERWLYGAPTYGTDLRDYRSYLISHEVGHSLGHHHVHCPHPGAPAPVMEQQTKSLEGCRPNWLPYRGGAATARG